jgi:hypothetical protein
MAAEGSEVLTYVGVGDDLSHFQPGMCEAGRTRYARLLVLAGIDVQQPQGQ